MRSLDTSLPKSRRRKQPSQPPEQIVQAFKSAALSVTNLYKTAANDQKIAREAGYQDALDDILAFLDQENIGLDDGEGWRIRQWATERLDGSPPLAAASDSEEERTEAAATRARSSSPAAQQTVQQDPPRQPSRSSSPTYPTPATAPTSGQIPVQPVVNNFTFCSHHPYPQDVEMQPSDGQEISRSSSSPQAENMPSSTVRLGLVPRGTRTPHRNGRNSLRSTPSGRVSNSATGSKRKPAFTDYFGIEGLGDGKDQLGGGGKRGRFA